MTSSTLLDVTIRYYCSLSLDGIVCLVRSLFYICHDYRPGLFLFLNKNRLVDIQY